MILILDGHNIMHRARSGFQAGDYPIVFNFFRQLRSLVEQFTPGRAIFVLEGQPKFRFDMYPEYKANRHPRDDDGKRQVDDFHRQKRIIVEILQNWFPISTMKHPDYECDDLIYNIIRNGSSGITYDVVSSDTDFIQLLNDFSNVNLYNPVKKEYVKNVPYNYCHWKALKGDESDNIVGIDGIGDVRAEQILKEHRLTEFLKDKPESKEIFERNLKLIKFATMKDTEMSAVQCSSPTKDWDAVARRFDEMGFQSLLKLKTFQKFVDTFDRLWV